MPVISDRNAVTETPDHAVLPSRQAHEQRPATVIPAPIMAFGTFVLGGAGIALAATSGKNGGLLTFGIVLIVIGRKKKPLIGYARD